MLQNKTYQDRRSKVKVTGLAGGFDTKTDVAPSFFGVSRWNEI